MGMFATAEGRDGQPGVCDVGISPRWVKHKELIKFNPSEAEIMGQISAGVNQHGSAGVNGTNPACASTGSGLVPAIVHSHKHC